MIPWIPLSVLSDLAQPRTAPAGDDLERPNPLGFTDVRGHAAPVFDAPAPSRPPIGFGPTPVTTPATEPVFRTELSFRRNRPAQHVVRAQATGDDEGRDLESVTYGAAGELWPGEPQETLPADDEPKTSFFKKELGLFRRKAKDETELEDDNVLVGEAVAETEFETPDVIELHVDATETIELDDELASEIILDDLNSEITLDDELTSEITIGDELTSEITHDDELTSAITFDDELSTQPAAIAFETVDSNGHEPAGAAATDDESDMDGDLWGNDDELATEGTDSDPGAPAPETVEPSSATDEVEEPAVAAVAEPAARNGRSVRLRSGGPKPKKRASGRGDRGGRKIVGLKFGASQLAAAVVQQVDGRSELLQVARVPLEPGIVVDGDVKDVAALTNALKAFFDDNALPRKDVRLGLSSNRIGVRTTDVVGIDDAERFDNAVRFKAHEVLPVAVHESVLDYRVIDERASEDGESLRRVLLVVAPRDQVEPYLAVCKDAGLRLTGVDLEALGLLRAFVEPRAVRAADDTATVVASIGHESSTLLVSGGGACEFTRVFDWGGSTLQEAIAQELDVHAAEAATILRHLALSGTPRPLASLDDDARQRAVDAVRSKLTPFARELVSSLQFYQTQPNSLGIGEIVITGGTSHLMGLADALHQMIGVNVRVGDPLQRVVSRTALDPAIEATIGSLAVPIGLAIDDEAVRSVNLLPSEMQQTGRKKPDWVKVAVPVAAAASIAALGFLFMQANGKVGDNQAQLDAVQAQIVALPKPKRPIIDADVAAGEAARAMALASVLGGRVSWDGVLRDVSLVLPGNVALTKLVAQLAPPMTADAAAAAQAAAATAPAVPTAPLLPTGVSIEGYTPDQQSVARLLSRLRTVPSLTNVQIQSSTRETVAKKQIVKFILLADIKQPGGAQ